jgi:hypothetical protein
MKEKYCLYKRYEFKKINQQFCIPDKFSLNKSSFAIFSAISFLLWHQCAFSKGLLFSQNSIFENPSLFSK